MVRVRVLSLTDRENAVMIGVMGVAHKFRDDDGLVERWGGLTWDEYLSLEDPPGFHFEFDAGRLIVSPAGRNHHSRLVGAVFRALGNYEECGDTCLVFARHSFFLTPGERDLHPDVAVVTDHRRKGVPRDGWMHGAPNIAIEVISSRTEVLDRGSKAARYFEHGSDELWLFDPMTESAELYRREPEGWQRAAAPDDRYETDLLPGFQLDLRDLFARARRGLDS